jgi:hypothetical protein
LGRKKNYNRRKKKTREEDDRTQPSPATGTTRPPTPRPAAEVAEQARVLRVGGGVVGLGRGSSPAPEIEAVEGGG